MIRKKPKAETILESIEAEGFALSRRSLPCKEGSIEILYIPQLTDRVSLMNFVIRPLSLYLERASNAAQALKAETIAESVLYADDFTLQTDEDEAAPLILDGRTILLIPGDDQYIVVNLNKVEHRSISDPMIEYTLRGPRDCFVENLNVNMALIRYRSKDANLPVQGWEADENQRGAVLHSGHRERPGRVADETAHPVDRSGQHRRIRRA